jgi:hypothetical protein
MTQIERKWRWVKLNKVLHITVKDSEFYGTPQMACGFGAGVDLFLKKGIPNERWKWASCRHLIG